MLPVLLLLTFDTPLMRALLFLAAFAFVAYSAYVGWRGAMLRPAVPRALAYGLAGAVAAWFGVNYALVNGIPLHTYGLMMATGFSLAVAFAGRRALQTYKGQRRLPDGTVVEAGAYMRDVVMDVAFYVLVSGIIGARLLFIIVNWDQYAKAPMTIFSLSGGLVFYGGFIGATLTMLWYARKHRFDMLPFADLAIPAVSLGHAFGRLGCLSAGCCWGGFARPGTRWALEFPGTGQAPFGQTSLTFESQIGDHRLLAESTHELLKQYTPDLDTAGHFAGTWTDHVTGAVLHTLPAGAIEVATEAARLGHTLPVYPTQLMESAGEFLLFGLLVVAQRKKTFDGQVLALWLMLYSVLRSTVETFRGDEERGRIFGAFASVSRTAWYNISTSQFVSVAIFAAGVVLWIRGVRGTHQDLPTETTA
jgi:phosphatidylglycerol:prolipoprotein diacylglycerol transferase